MTNFRFESTGEEVAEAFQDEIKNLIIVITGSSAGGIGGETAVSLAVGAPRQLVLLSRDISKSESVISKIKTRSPNISVSFVQCDLSNQKSVRKAATEIAGLVPHINVLINNAANPPGLYRKTEDGIESQFATNHIGHFLLTNLLMPKILAAKPQARIVNVASSAYRHRKHASFDDYNFSDGGKYSAWEGYMQSKQANIMFSVSLARQLQHNQVLCFSLHPGGIATGMEAQVPKEAMEQAIKQRREAAAKEGKETPKVPRKTLQQGCATTLVAALDPSISEHSGAYLIDGGISKDPLPGFITDEENVKKLWELSEHLVGEAFDWKS